MLKFYIYVVQTVLQKKNKQTWLIGLCLGTKFQIMTNGYSWDWYDSEEPSLKGGGGAQRVLASSEF